MNIKEMHYDFKRKLNKVDSSTYRNLKIPEIDTYLNEAQELFVKIVAYPRLRSYLGLEKGQRSIDDIRSLVKNDEALTVTANVSTLPSGTTSVDISGVHDGANDVAILTDSTASWVVDEWVNHTILNLTDGSSGTITANTATTITVTLAGGAENDWDTNDIYEIKPREYWHFIRGRVLMDKGTCTGVQGVVRIRQHDDEFEEGNFSKSSFEWRTVNAVFFENGIKFYTDGTFTITSFLLSYLRRPAYIHNAEDYSGTQYNLPGGATLTGTQDCELPAHTHREIVDIAVALASGELLYPDYNVKLGKLNLNNLK